LNAKLDVNIKSTLGFKGQEHYDSFTFTLISAANQENENSGGCGTYGRERNMCTILMGKSEQKETTVL
jgi:hypothetical protein